MAQQKASNSEKRGPGIKTKLILALGAIAAIMLISCGVSIFEYNRMNSYLSGVVGQMSVVTDTLACPAPVSSSQVHEDLNQVYYRSLMPGIVTMGVGILLVLMLLFFLLSYYVNPIYKMLDELSKYESYGKRYDLTFDGADQLLDLNSRISDLSGENIQLRRRIEALKKNEPESDK